MALPDAHHFVETVSAWSRNARVLPQLSDAVVGLGIPLGPALAYLSFARQSPYLVGRYVTAPSRKLWFAWVRNGDVWRIIEGYGSSDWAALADDDLIVGVVCWVNERRVLRAGKDPFYWLDGPRDAKFGRGETDGVPDGINAHLVKRGVWVSDAEMAWVRWLSATMFWPDLR